MYCMTLVVQVLGRKAYQMQTSSVRRRIGCMLVQRLHSCLVSSSAETGRQRLVCCSYALTATLSVVHAFALALLFLMHDRISRAEAFVTLTDVHILCGVLVVISTTSVA